MFPIDMTEFGFVLSKISLLISPQEINGDHKPILALTLRYKATGGSFQSTSFQFRISLNAVP